MLLLLLIAYVLVINGVTYWLYWRDKCAQAKREPRVPENILLMAGFAGGTPAALLANKRWRHKVKNSAFQHRLHMLTVLQTCMIVFLPAPVLYLL